MATPATNASKVGYYEDTVTTTIHAETGLSVWVPLKSSHDGPLHGPYTFTESARKFWRNFSGMDIGLLSDEQRFELPSVAYSATSKDAVSPRGIVVYLHGVACTRWDLWKLAEELASEGYIFAAPGFANSAANDRKDMMGSFGGGMARGELAYESLALRTHTMERVREHLLSVFGQLPLGLIGHSMGGDTINLLNWDVPKCIISGGAFGPDGVASPAPGPDGTGILFPWGSPESGRPNPLPVTQGSASLTFLSRSGDMFFPDVCLAGFTFDRIDLTDEEPSSVPQGDLPKHCMVTVDGIDHTTWLIDVVEHVFKKLKPFDMLYEKLGVDVFDNYAPPKQRGQKLYDNVMRPLIKRFFAKHVVEVGKKGRKASKGSLF